MTATLEQRESGAENGNAVSEHLAVNKARIEAIRTHKLQQMIDKVQQYGTYGYSDIAGLEAGVQHIDVKNEQDIAGWESFLETMPQKATQLWGNLQDQLQSAMSEKLMSSASRSKWIDRYQDPNTSHLTKKYFVENELPRRIKNLRKLKEDRARLSNNPLFVSLTTNDVPRLAAFTSESAFLELHFDERKDLVARVNAALLTREKSKRGLHDLAKGKLEKAVRSGYLSKQKVGIWMERIFSATQPTEKIQKFLQSADTKSLEGLITTWARVRFNYDRVLQKFEHEQKQGLAPIGFHFVSEKEFLNMHYAQRISFVKEAERTLEAGSTPEKENPLLLQIRHYLDIKDWEDADASIKKAQHMSLSDADRSRLVSMRQYLAQHRTDKTHPSMKKTVDNEAIAQARETLSMSLAGMDFSMRELTLHMLRYGNSGINKVRWVLYNRLWCEKNGYMNDKKAQNSLTRNEEQSIQAAKAGKDMGRDDAITTGDSRLMRREEHQRKSKSRATILHVNVSDEGARAQFVEQLKTRGPYFLYWGTMVASKNGETMSVAWHMQQLEALNQIRSATRILDAAGIPPPYLNTAPRPDATSYATAA